MHPLAPPLPSTHLRRVLCAQRRDALNAEIEQKLRKRQRQSQHPNTSLHHTPPSPTSSSSSSSPAHSPPPAFSLRVPSEDDDDVADDGWSSQAAKKQRADGEEGVEEEAQVEGLDAAGAAEDGREDGHDADAAPLPVPLPPRPSTAWKYEDDVALVTVHTHSLDADDPQPPSDHEGAEEGRGEAGAASTPGTATGWRGQQPLGFTGGGRPGAPGSSKKALGKKKLKKKDKRGPRRLMKGKKEKALGSAKKGKGRR